MPWYRIYASHGPGHQSSTEFYRYYSAVLDTKQKRKDAWDEAFDDGRYDWPIGDVELCERLPQHIHDEKVTGFESSIRHAYNMLEVLRKTDTKPVIAVRLEVKPPIKQGDTSFKQGDTSFSGFQARLLAEPTVLGPMKRTRDEAVDALLSVFRRENRKVMKAKKGATRYSRRKDYTVISR
jgi:hypothetical protein